MSKDLNYIANVEKAVAKKYGKEAICNPKSLWNEEKEERYLKDLDVKFTNAFMGFVGCITLVILSILFEGNTIFYLKNLDSDAWFLALYHGIVCSLMGHMAMFYLYKFYPNIKLYLKKYGN